MSNITNILIANTDTPRGQHLDRWQLEVSDRARGVQGAGYHFAVQPDGEVITLREETEWGNYPSKYAQYNHNSLMVRLVGNTEEGYPCEQMTAMRKLLDSLLHRHDDALPFFIY